MRQLKRDLLNESTHKFPLNTPLKVSLVSEVSRKFVDLVLGCAPDEV